MLVLLSVLLLSSHVLPLVQSLTCNKETEYLKNNRCCKKCEPGQLMVERCKEGSETLCDTCGDGFFMDVYNENILWCSECKMCTKEYMKYETYCTPKSNAVCTCEEGYRCSDSNCEMCVKVQTTTTSLPPARPASTKTAPHSQDMKYEKNCTPKSNAVCTCEEGYRCSDSKCKMCVKVQTTTASPRPASTKTAPHTQNMHDHVDGSCQHQPVSGPPKRATLDPVSAQRKRKYQCQCRRCVERQRNWRMSEKGGGRRPLMRLRIEYLL